MLLSNTPHSPSPTHSDHGPLTVRLLGPGAFVRGLPLRFPYARVQALLVMLLLEPGGWAREHLMDALWPMQGAGTARGNLRHALHALRRLAGELRVQTQRDRVFWHLQPGDSVDLHALGQSGAQPTGLLEDYQGELMAGWVLADAPGFMAWLDQVRARTHVAVVHHVEQWHARSVALGQDDQRIAAARLQTRIDPWHELPHLHLMRALMDAGRASEALAHFELSRSIFRSALDAEPGGALRALAAQLQQRLRMPAVQAPASTAPGRAPDQVAERTSDLESDPAPDPTPDPRTDCSAGAAWQTVALLHVDCPAIDSRDARAAAAVQRIRQALQAATQPLDGRMQAGLGASWLLRFAGTTRRQSPCERALQAALEVRDAWQQPGVESVLQLRIGLHRGPVMTDAMAQEPLSLDPLGQVTGVAQAVGAGGRPGDILASPAFARILPSRHWVPQSLQDHSNGEPGFAVLRLAAEPWATQRTVPALVGRRRQQSVLLRRWRAACRGMARGLLLLGSPGVGKTRIVGWAQQQLPGARSVWRIDCTPALREAPGAALAEWLHTVTGLGPGRPPAQALPRFRQALQLLASDLAEPAILTLARLMGLLAEDADQLPTQRRKDLLDALVAMAAAALRNGPLLLVVEDLHWADGTTLQVLHALLQRLADRPLLVLATARPQAQSLLDWPVLEVDALPPLDAQALARTLLGTDPTRRVDSQTLDDIVRQAGGNPLFIESLVDAAARQQHGPGTHASLSLSAGLAAPLQDAPALETLAQAASVLGEHFDRQQLRGLCATLSDDAFHTAWRQLLRHGLVHAVVRPGVALGRFHHALIRDAVYDSLGAADKRQLHARVVALAQAATHANPQPQWLAHHAEQAGDLETALTAYETAARRALDVAAFDEAVALFNHALRLVERLPATPDCQDRLLRLALARAQATMPLHGYGAQITRESFRLVLAHGGARHGSDAVFQAHHGLWLGASSSVGYRQALAYAERLQRHADASSNTVHRLQAAYAWGNTLLWLGELEAAQRHLEHAVALHADLPDGALFAAYGEDTGVTAQALLAWVLWLRGDEAAALRQATAALQLADRLAHPYSQAFALACAARLAVMRGDADSVPDLTQRLDALATRHGLALWQAVGGVQLGWWLCLQGHPDGPGLAARSVELAAPALPALAVTMLSMQADALWRIGNLAACAQVVRQALAECERWDDRHLQPELLRLATVCEPSHAQATQWHAQAVALARQQGALAWLQRLESA